MTQEKTVTKKELSENNGKNGKPAYIALRGKVYDVTNSVFWTEGDHMGSHEAGKDLTSEIELAPHTEDVIKRTVLVGTLL